MSSTFFSALSGMRSHQQWIEVIGNNLANTNTPGFKAATATFSDGLQNTLRSASSPGASRGGVNPMQIGRGVELANIDRTFAQGALSRTGRPFDLAIEGSGYFVLRGGGERVFSRVGTMGLDAEFNLVDQRSGFRVLDAEGLELKVDIEGLFPPAATGNVTLVGNLPAVVTGPLPEELTGAAGLMRGFPAMQTGTVAGPNYAVPASSTFTLGIAVNGAAPEVISVTDADGDGVLLDTEIAAALDAATGVTAAVGAGGFIEITSERTGEGITLQVSPGQTNDLANLISMPLTVASGSEDVVTPTTDLNELPANLVNYANGDEIRIAGVDTDGSAVNSVFTYGVDGTTVDDLISFIDGLYQDANVSLNASGQIVVTAQTPGDAELLLTVADEAGNTGETLWGQYATAVTTEGTGPDIATTTFEIFDTTGIPHNLTVQWVRQNDATWNVQASLPAGEGTVLVGGENDPITGLTFAQDGSPTNLGSVDSRVSIIFDGQAQAQELDLDFGVDGGFEGLTQFGSQVSAHVRAQDGYGDGELANISVNSSGAIEGFYTNGEFRILGQIGVATFTNQEGLQEVGNNMWAETSNSGTPALGIGAELGRGAVIGGALENSNVDTAEQFVSLIEAQRGFQANARVITTQNEVLAETVNLI
ncbi:MAG: flagellar hook-basal body complex protein [bacterium]|nr:flagellar hook-basal body complex protein [bacterium]